MNPALLLTLAALAPAAPRHDAPPPAAVVVAERDRGHDHGHGHDGFEVRCPRDVDAAFAALDQALYELADDVDDLKGRERRRMRENLAALADAAEDARERACRSAAPPPVVVVPPPPPPRAPLLDESAHRLNVAAMKRESFDDGRLRVLDTAVRGEVCLTSPQVRDYLKTMTFSSNRVDVLRRLAPRLVDDGQAVTLFSALDFESEKRDAQQVLSSAKTLPQCRLPWR